MTDVYIPGRFNSTYERENGEAIWSFMNESENIIRMETATYLARPAVEPLSPGLLERFGNPIAEDRIKQMLGHMTRQIMERLGYRLERNGVRITRDGNIFTSASRYTA
ncbi:hypothetical protein [Hoeflea olei]|uniref:Uncharacterized protein n=1 Tax=Hoeflea olei TaxID=1480615 RepID=A0A1C1YZX9_9HYPH|nr:hypothetical protein [Hoeflea olei]OCW58989.1 hypothetical protein AWJ14_04565 [Hoeflea olei]